VCVCICMIVCVCVCMCVCVCVCGVFALTPVRPTHATGKRRRRRALCCGVARGCRAAITRVYSATMIAAAVVLWFFGGVHAADNATQVKFSCGEWVVPNTDSVYAVRVFQKAAEVRCASVCDIFLAFFPRRPCIRVDVQQHD